MRHAKRWCKILSITLCCVSSGMFIQHECTVASGTSAAQSRREHLSHVCVSLWVNLEPSAVPAAPCIPTVTELPVTSVNMESMCSQGFSYFWNETDKGGCILCIRWDIYIRYTCVWRILQQKYKSSRHSSKYSLYPEHEHELMISTSQREFLLFRCFIQLWFIQLYIRKFSSTF